MDWWVQWARYVGWWEPRGNRPGRGFGDPNAEPGAAPRPPHPVRNKPVMDTALPGALVKGITIDHDYKLLPEAVRAVGTMPSLPCLAHTCTHTHICLCAYPS